LNPTLVAGAVAVLFNVPDVVVPAIDAPAVKYTIGIPEACPEPPKISAGLAALEVTAKQYQPGAKITFDAEKAIFFTPVEGAKVVPAVGPI
jgi:hypothetical protein